MTNIWYESESESVRSLILHIDFRTIRHSLLIVFL